MKVELSLEGEGDESPGALLCDRFRFAGGRFVVGRSGEEEDNTIGGGLSTIASIKVIYGNSDG